MKPFYEGKSEQGGVYKIINKANGRIYIGKTKCFCKRFYEHKRRLLSNRHGNAFLQHDFNKCGSSVFEFHILETVSEYGKQNEKEEYWISQYYDNQNQCYNFKKKSNALPRSVFSNNPDITKKILSEKSKAMWAEPNLRKKILKRKNEVMKTPEYKKALQEGLKKSWNNQERRKKASERIKRECASGARDHIIKNFLKHQPKGRKTFKKRMKEDLEFKKKYQESGRRKVAKIQERYKNDPEFNKKMDEHSRKNIIKYNKTRSFTKKPIFVSPEGKEYREIYNLADFARKHKLDPSNMYKLVKGSCKQAKGWTIKK